MVIHSSIIAGQILAYLEEGKKAASIKELVYFLEQPIALIEAGIERLVKEELAVLDVEKDEIKIVSMPKFDQEQIETKQRFYKRMAGV